MKKLIISFSHAFAGIRSLFAHERNAKWHLLFATIAVVLGFYTQISKFEWIVVLVCIAMVISAEAYNTAIEKLCDIVQPEKDPRIKVIKDVSAAAVLILSLAALIIGGLIFVPKLIN